MTPTSRNKRGKQVKRLFGLTVEGSRGWNADETGLGVEIVVNHDMMTKSGRALCIRGQYGSTWFDVVFYFGKRYETIDELCEARGKVWGELADCEVI